MEKSVLKVGGMSREHGVKAVTKAVGSLPSVDGAAADLRGKR
jgi:copper chaperone CopZ